MPKAGGAIALALEGLVLYEEVFVSSNSWTVRDSEFLDHLYEMANYHSAECASSLMAPEDRAEEQEALSTAELAIAAFEDCKTEFIENLEKSLGEN